MLDFGQNIWVEKFNIEQLKDELDNAWLSRDPQREIESILKNAVDTFVIRSYRVSVSKGFYSATYGAVEIVGKSGTIYTWHS